MSVIDREWQLNVLLGFMTFGTHDQAVRTAERLRRMLSLEMGRPIELLEVEVGAYDSGGPTTTADAFDQQPTDGDAPGDHDARAGHGAGAAGRSGDAVLTAASGSDDDPHDGAAAVDFSE